MAPETRQARIDAILAVGRDTRKPASRGLWIAAAIVGAVCAAGFAIMMLGDPAPPAHRLERRPEAASASSASSASSPGGRSGLGIGLWIGAGVGVVIGFAIARHRGDHSSRNSP